MRQAPNWAADPLESDRYAQNNVEIPRYASIERDFSRVSQTIISEFQRGTIDRRTAMQVFRESLQSAENAAFAAGRRARGFASLEITDSEAAVLQARNDWNMGYWSNFLDDVETGRGRLPYNQRADQYAKSLWSVYTRGETLDWNEPENFGRGLWILDPDAEHCLGCIENARKSRDNNGFTYDELMIIGFPGENTPCRVFCRCHIQWLKSRRQAPNDRVNPAPDPRSGLEDFIDALGGPNLPATMSASGIPEVKIRPSDFRDIVSSWQTPAVAEQMAMMLPVFPNLLIKPAAVVPWGDDRRFYIGNGATIQIDRQDGAWMLVAAFFGLPLFLVNAINSGHPLAPNPLMTYNHQSVL